MLALGYSNEIFDQIVFTANIKRLLLVVITRDFFPKAEVVHVNSLKSAFYCNTHGVF